MLVPYSILRALAMLRRIHKELAKGNVIAEARYSLERDRMAMDYPEWYRKGGVPAPTKKVKFDRASVEDWNKNHEEDNG